MVGLMLDDETGVQDKMHGRDVAAMIEEIREVVEKHGFSISMSGTWASFRIFFGRAALREIADTYK